MNKCYRCGKVATYETKDGLFVCHKRSVKCEVVREQISKAKKGSIPWNAGTKGQLLTTPWNKGHTKVNNIKLLEKSLRFKKNYDLGKYKGSYTGHPKTEEGKQNKSNKLSESIRKRYDAGWMPKAGRCKKIKYISKIAGEVLLDGSWELLVAQYLDKVNINWQRNLNKFPYVYNNKDRTYTPDFYLIDLNLYVEVKGYKTDLDEAKWNAFTSDLVVLYKKEINKIKRGEVLKWFKRTVC